MAWKKSSKGKRPPSQTTRREYTFDDALASAGKMAMAWPNGAIGVSRAAALCNGLGKLMQTTESVAVEGMRPLGVILSPFLGLEETALRTTIGRDVAELADRLNCVACVLLAMSASADEYDVAWMSIGRALSERLRSLNGDEMIEAYASGVLSYAVDAKRVVVSSNQGPLTLAGAMGYQGQWQPHGGLAGGAQPQPQPQPQLQPPGLSGAGAVRGAVKGAGAGLLVGQPVAGGVVGAAAGSGVLGETAQELVGELPNPQIGMQPQPGVQSRGFPVRGRATVQQPQQQQPQQQQLPNGQQQQLPQQGSPPHSLNFGADENPQFQTDGAGGTIGAGALGLVGGALGGPQVGGALAQLGGLAGGGIELGVRKAGA